MIEIRWNQRTHYHLSADVGNIKANIVVVETDMNDIFEWSIEHPYGTSFGTHPDLVTALRVASLVIAQVQG